MLCSTCAYFCFCLTCWRLKACFILVTWQLCLAHKCPKINRRGLYITSQDSHSFQAKRTLNIYFDSLWRLPLNVCFCFEAFSDSIDPVCFAQPENSGIFFSYIHAPVFVQWAVHTDFNSKGSQIKALPWTQTSSTLASLLILLSTLPFRGGVSKVRTCWLRVEINYWWINSPDPPTPRTRQWGWNPCLNTQWLLQVTTPKLYETHKSTKSYYSKKTLGGFWIQDFWITGRFCLWT